MLKVATRGFRVARAAVILAFFLFEIPVPGACRGRFEPTRELPSGPSAKGGVLDLRGWDFARSGSVTLSGEWLFFPHKLISEAEAFADGDGTLREIPDFWKGSEAGGTNGMGAGTYRLRILLPSAFPALAIRNQAVATSFEIEVDGRIVASGGRPAISREAAVAGYNPAVSSVSPKSGALDVVVRVSNHEYRAGGIWRAFVLGPRDRLETQKRFAVYSALVIFAALSAISLYSLCVFAFRRKERRFLYFALFGLATAFRVLVTGEYVLIDIFPAIRFGLLVRLEYATAFLSLPAAAVFFLELFKGIRGRAWTFLFTLPFAPFLLFDIFAPLPFLTWSIFCFYGVALAVLIAVVATVLVPAAGGHRPGGVAMLAGAAAICLTGINDILYSSLILRTGTLHPYAIALFVCLQAVVLARRFTRAFDEVEVLSAELARSNDLLRSEVERVTEVGARLESSLAEKEMLMREVHHRVKNSLQIVSSILALQSGKSKDPVVGEITKAIRDRIRAISIAHEKLYNVGSGESIDLEEYARELVGLNVSSFGMAEGAVDVRVDAEPMDVGADICIDIGLLLTELLTNSLKHAILPRGRGTVRIALRMEGSEIVLEVADDGAGFPAGLAPAECSSMGFVIVMALIRKRGGSLAVSEGGHPTVTCRLPVSAADLRPAPA